MKKNKSSIITLFTLMLLHGCGKTPPATELEPRQGKKESSHTPQPSSIHSANETSTIEKNSPGSALETLPPFSTENIALRLGVRVQFGSAGNNPPPLPDPAADLIVSGPLDEAITQDNEINYTSKLFLKDSNSQNPLRQRELYFVWPEKSLGLPIQGVTYTHSVRNIHLQGNPNFHPRAAHHDTDNHRWYIPIAHIFRDPLTQQQIPVNPSDSQEVRLEISLENGPNQIVNLHFQIIDPIPQMIWTPLELGQPANTHQLIQETSQEGITIYKEQVQNPSHQSYRLWIRSQANLSAASLRTWLHYPKYTGNADREPTGPVARYADSLGQLKVSKMIAVHENQATETFNLLNQEWISILLHPQETVTLKWKALRTAATPLCSLPMSQSIPFNWQTLPPPLDLAGYWTELQKVPPLVRPSVYQFMENRRRDLELERKPTFHTIHRIINWSFAGARLESRWSREIRVTYPFISEEEATSNPRERADQESDYFIGFRPLKSGNLESLRQAGLMPQANKPFTCQGVFP